MKSLYIHIPFCNNICTYCDFCKIYYNKNYVKSYLKALNNELNKKYNGEALETIYIGGGSPSSLDYDELEYLLKMISVIKKSVNYEYTIECNPDDLDDRKIELIKKYGVNRVSIGVQTFNQDNLKLLYRCHNNEQVFSVIDKLKKIGIDNINIDMMFAIPNQTIESLKEDLLVISNLDIKHVSYYSLILEEHTKLYIDKFRVFDEDLEYKMYDLICKYLSKLGFNHYEISNFSKEGYLSKHNLTYWNNNEYAAIGLGACSYIKKEVFENTKNINKYINNEFLYSKTLLSKNDILVNELMLNLRLIEGINKNKFKDKYNIDINKVFDFNDEINKGRIIDNGENIFINSKYLYVSNDIITNILIKGVYNE